MGARRVLEHVRGADRRASTTPAIIFKRALGQGRITRITASRVTCAQLRRARRRGASCCRSGTPRRNWKQTLVSDGYIMLRHPDWATACKLAEYRRDPGRDVRRVALTLRRRLRFRVTSPHRRRWSNDRYPPRDRSRARARAPPPGADGAAGSSSWRLGSPDTTSSAASSCSSSFDAISMKSSSVTMPTRRSSCDDRAGSRPVAGASAQRLDRRRLGRHGDDARAS